MFTNTRNLSRTVRAIVVVAVVATAGSAAAQVSINEIFYLGASAGADWVELKNSGAAAVDVSNYWLCARFSYARVGALTLTHGSGFTIPPGGIIVVVSWVNLNGTSSDMGLYDSSSFGSSSAMKDFVQWGGGGIGRESVAVAAGLWGTGDFVTTAGSGHSLMWSGNSSGGGAKTLSSDFANDVPTAGAENAPVATEEVTWGRVKGLYRE